MQFALGRSWIALSTVLSIASLAVVPELAGGKARAGGSIPVVTRSTPVAPGSRYLALGDSVPFGYQEGAVVPPPDYRKPSTFLGYPEQLGSELHLQVTNAACPGETSGSLINTSVQSNGCENAYRKAFPLHVRYSGSQLAFAILFLRSHRDVRLVSLMVGANDLFICQKTTPDACGSPSEQKRVFSQIAGNVRRIVAALRNAAGYRGQLAIVNYYSLNYSSAFINNVTLGLDKAIDGAAKPFHPVFADGFGEFKAAAAKSGGSSCTAGLLTQLGMPGTCGVHPTYAGQALLAQALLKVIRLQ